MRRLVRKQWEKIGTAVSDLVHTHKQQLFFTVKDPSNHTVEYQSFGLMMGRQGMNDDDDDDTMDNLKHIWPNTFTKLHNLSFKVNSWLQMIAYILYYCSIMLWSITEQDQEKDYMHFKKIIKARTKLYSTLCMSCVIMF